MCKLLLPSSVISLIVPDRELSFVLFEDEIRRYTTKP